MSLGDWGVGVEIPESRVAFAFEMWMDENGYNVAMTDASSSPWKDAAIIGKKQSREEALAHPWMDDVFHLTDHMVTDDPAIKDFFETVH